MPTTAITQGVHHIGLTVPDIDATRAFFTDTLGFEVVGGRPAYPSVFVSDGATMITIWQAADPTAATAFDRKVNVGLHHLALKVADHQTLQELGEKLAGTEGVVIEFAPEPLGETPLRHMVCAIPGGIRMELIAAG